MYFEEETGKKEFVEMKVDLDPVEAKELRDLGLKLIENDENELINYAINYLLRKGMGVEGVKEVKEENGSKS
jgi:hypothetical protein